MHRQRGPRHELIIFIVALTFAILVSRHAHAEVPPVGNQLQLEVYVNELPINLIGSFVQLSDRRMAARPTDLADIGIKLADSAAGSEFLVLDDIPGITYRYDEPGQRIFLKVGDGQLVPKHYDIRGTPSIAPARADFGAVTNYSLFASSTASFPGSRFGFSASIDSRVFGPYGTLRQTAILGTTPTREGNALRLDTTWSYSDPESMRTYRVGRRHLRRACLDAPDSPRRCAGAAQFFVAARPRHDASAFGQRQRRCALDARRLRQ
jgi:outer membrane usher protein